MDKSHEGVRKMWPLNQPFIKIFFVFDNRDMEVSTTQGDEKHNRKGPI